MVGKEKLGGNRLLVRRAATCDETRHGGLTLSVLAFAALACFLCFATGCGGADRPVAAKFYDEVIYEDEVTEYTADFRAASSYSTNEIWAEYLAEQDLTTETWRERVIGRLAEQRLIKRKAAELGISADQERIQSQVALDKESAGITADDEEAWEQHLQSLGITEEEYLDALELSSLEQQLYLHELSFDPESNTQAIRDYITDNLSDRVFRRWSALCFDDKGTAEEALASLSGLAGDELKSRFAELAGEDDSDATNAENGGDIGWDLVYDLGEAREDLSAEGVKEGAVSQSVHELDGSYWLFYCSKRFVFKAEMGYDDLPDDDLKDAVLNAVTYQEWSSMAADYVAGLVEDAQVQVSHKPSDLPYDVDDLIPETEAYKARASAEQL